MNSLVESGLATTNAHSIAPPSTTATDHPVAIARYDGQHAAAGEPPIRSLSIVIPVHNEEGNLVELHRRLTGVLAEIGLPYDIIFVDDGSKDGTWHVIQSLHNQDPRVVALRHRRNFGKAQGLANGFAVATGDVVITMDGDLQDDPSELPRFLAKLDEGYDLVSGWKQRRQDPLGKTAPSKVFNCHRPPRLRRPTPRLQLRFQSLPARSHPVKSASTASSTASLPSSPTPRASASPNSRSSTTPAPGVNPNTATSVSSRVSSIS